MRSSSFLFLLAVVFGSSALSAQLNERFIEQDNALTRRQQFKPSITTAEGSTCADAFGTGYTTCREAGNGRNRLCYNPKVGQSCCDSTWACPSGAFCLVSDFCCPTGQTPQSCASENGVSISSGFQAPTSAATSSGIMASKATDTSSPAPAVAAGDLTHKTFNMAGLAAAIFGVAAVL